MNLYVLDPSRYQDFLNNKLCPCCGHKPEPGDPHMERLVINDIPTWGCYVKGDSKPVRSGLLVSR